MKKVIRTSITPGKASSPSIMQLQQFGIDVNKIVQEINEKTKILTKYKIPSITVEVEIDLNTKEYSIKYELPAVTELLLKAVGKDEGSHQGPKEIIGDINLETVAEITYIKWDEMKCKTFKACLKQVVSTCRTIGLTINGKDPKEILVEIDRGVYQNIIGKYEELLKKEERI